MGGQAVVEISISILGLLVSIGGFVLKSFQSELKELRDKQQTQADKIGDIEVLVAGAYVTRQEMIQAMSSVNAKLDRISEQIAQKADR
jgi:hypothetical protein